MTGCKTTYLKPSLNTHGLDVPGGQHFGFIHSSGAMHFSSVFVVGLLLSCSTACCFLILFCLPFLGIFVKKNEREMKVLVDLQMEKRIQKIGTKNITGVQFPARWSESHGRSKATYDDRVPTQNREKCHASEEGGRSNRSQFESRRTSECIRK